MINQFQRNPVRELPDGSISKVFPFHISLEGLKERILCREDRDYDVFVKIICLCSRRKNCIPVAYAVVSNHAHFVVLANSQESANDCAAEVKRMISMFFCRKYSDNAVMKGIDSKALWIDSDWYLRNALAYDIRNAMDNGASSIQSYKWTCFRGMFCNGTVLTETRLVSELKRREQKEIMHTGDILDDVKWRLNGNNELEPASVCDWQYFEDAFLNDQAYFMKTIGNVNSSEMGQKLVNAPRERVKDEEMLRSVNDISRNWFKTEVHFLPLDKKARLIKYVYRCMRTNVSQMARVFELNREKTEELVQGRIKKPRP